MTSDAPSNGKGNAMKCISAFVPAGLLFLGMAVLFPLTAAAIELYSFQGEGGKIYFTNTPGPGHRKINPYALRMRPKKKASVPWRTGMGPASEQEEFAEAILSACEHFAVDPHLVRAVIKAESNFDPGARSPKGAIGLMQLMPNTAREMGVSDPFNPVENIFGGVGYLSQLLNSMNGDLPLALAAYNAGPQRVMNYNGIPPFRETRNYIERVLDYYEHFKGKNSL